MPSESAFRTEASTPQSTNERIRRETVANVYATLASGGDAIDARLRELDAEWDTERTLETLAATFVLSGLALAATVNRRWLALPAVVGAFLLQHGVQGWCPPLFVIRALGVRTPREIASERVALKAARGDFAAAHDATELGSARALLASATQ